MNSETSLKKRHKNTNHRTRIIVLGFLFLILVSSFLLNLPIASQDGEPVGLLNAIFTATSAICVTGLVVVNTLEHWTLFGQIIILLLIQVGGLGFMTFVTIILMVARKKIMLNERMILQESLNQNSAKGIVKFVQRIVIGTLLFEGLGALLLALRFMRDVPFGRAVYMGIFHSISAFCNAGFDIVGPESMVPYAGSLWINLVLMALIVIGGLGFTVWVDCLRCIRERKSVPFKTRLKRLSLHSKIVLTMTPALILLGMVFFFFAEYSNPATLKPLPFGEKVLASLFQSVTTRTAGYNSISQSGMSYASKLMSILLMFIGGSPGSTAGGVKTVTTGILIIAVLSVVKGRNTTTIYHKSIPFLTLQKALSVFLISFTAVIGITMILTVTEKNMPVPCEFLDLLFETVSAMGTVGLSTGITPHLSNIGKALISVAMFMGRLGPVTIAVSLARKQKATVALVDYPEENVIVG